MGFVGYVRLNMFLYSSPYLDPTLQHALTSSTPVLLLDSVTPLSHHRSLSLYPLLIQKLFESNSTINAFLSLTKLLNLIPEYKNK